MECGFYCEYCDTSQHIDNYWKDGRCNDCRDAAFYLCSCGEYQDRERAYQVEEEEVCESCFEDSWSCEDCGLAFTDSQEPRYIGDFQEGPFCENCVDQNRETQEEIKFEGGREDETNTIVSSLQ